MTRSAIQPVTAQDVRRRATGMLAGAGFGGVWAMMGLAGRHGGCAAFLGAAALAILAGLLAAAVDLFRIARHAGLPLAAGGARHRIRRGFLLVLAAEIVAMNLAAWALYPRHMDYLMPTIALIVGLHFLPLAALLRLPHLRIAAFAMSAAALAGIAALALDLGGGAAGALLDAACALALWTTCFASWRSLRLHPASRTVAA